MLTGPTSLREADRQAKATDISHSSAGILARGSLQLRGSLSEAAHHTARDCLKNGQTVLRADQDWWYRRPRPPSTGKAAASSGLAFAFQVPVSSAEDAWRRVLHPMTCLSRIAAQMVQD